MVLVKSTIKDNIAIITMTSGVTNPINSELVSAFINKLDKIEKKASDLQGLIVTSNSNKFYSIGFDIPKLIKLKERDLLKFYQDFNELCLKIFTLPIPTLSALTGHYVAAGCIIAASTDFRLLAEGSAKTGVTATKLGLPVPYLAKRIVHQRLEARTAYELLTTGELYGPNWATSVGFIDKVMPSNKLLNGAVKFIKDFDPDQNFTYLRNKQEKAEAIKRDYLMEKENDYEKFISTWFSDSVQEALHEAKSKF